MSATLARVEAHVFRTPIDVPVRTSFGIMTERAAVLQRGSVVWQGEAAALRDDPESLERWLGIVIKELTQLRRDRLTFGMVVGIPVVQLVLFGFAINADPKGLPTAVLAAEHSQLSRSIVAAIANTGYFTITREAATEAELRDQGLI